MRSSTPRLPFILLACALFAASQALGYFWFTDSELTRFGDRAGTFWSGDTLTGDIRSNGQIAIMGSPVFMGHVITTAPDFWHGAGYNPIFLGPPPTFNAPPLNFPESAADLRAGAMSQGHFISDPGQQYRAHFHDGMVDIYAWTLGTMFDSTLMQTLAIITPTCIFFDGPCDVFGTVQGRVTLGCSGTMRLLNDIRYADADSLTGQTPSTSNNFLGLISESEIKVANTPANGRWNSDGLGYNQTDRNYASIVITAAVAALGESFTFEQQNDPDSGYVCLDCEGARDDRGYIYLYGSLWQTRRGYFHRSTLTSTGYLKQLRYDARFVQTRPPCFITFDEEPWSVDPDTLQFGNVPVGTTVTDTVVITLDEAGTLGSVYATHPFYATRRPPYYGTRFAIPVSFTPNRTGPFMGTLSASTTPHYFQIPLRGRGVQGGSPPLALTAAPNPFNNVTTIRYTLPAQGDVRLVLYDVLGRAARDLHFPAQAPGEHAYSLDAITLASGVYFVHLEAAGQRVTRKLLLLK